MNNFPFFPYRNYYNYNTRNYNSITPNRFTNNFNTISTDLIYTDNSNYKNSLNIKESISQNNDKKKSSRYSFGPISFNSSSLSNSDESIIELFGLKLYLDDIIILLLLFFLYQEGVKDDILFICLILLLLG